MIPKDLLKRIRQIELRTRRLVNESLSGAYHSVFKGQGMNFDEVREYQPGDDVRAIDWNVTARMNHPFIKKFVEERELTVMLMVDLSASGVFGSGTQTKRELAAEIASVLAFSAIRNSDKVGLILFTDEIEAYLPPRKGRRHVLRVIREILFFEPKRRGTNLSVPLEFLLKVTSHKSIAVLLSDFMAPLTPSLVRQCNRRHDLVAVQIEDRHEWELPQLGYLLVRDAETGHMMEINTGNERQRKNFTTRRQQMATELEKLLAGAGVDRIRLRTDTSYSVALARFFEIRQNRRAHV